METEKEFTFDENQIVRFPISVGATGYMQKIDGIAYANDSENLFDRG